jgi:hypothetical protein
MQVPNKLNQTIKTKSNLFIARCYPDYEAPTTYSMMPCSGPPTAPSWSTRRTISGFSTSGGA